jgi:hypothetical protein
MTQHNTAYITEYIGESLHGVPHGYGELIHSNGCYYKGDWVHGKKQGNGTLKWLSFVELENGFEKFCEYIGGWCDDEKDGHGVVTYPNNESYTGDWKNGDYHGFGTLVRPYGRVYTGQFECDKKHGEGTEVYNHITLIYEQKDHPFGVDIGYLTVDYENELKSCDRIREGRYIGNWKKGYHYGYGVEYLIDGGSFVGEWESYFNKRVGVEVLADGTIYRNTYKKGRLHGDGEEVAPDGTKYVGKWLNGKKRYKFNVIDPCGVTTVVNFK